MEKINTTYQQYQKKIIPYLDGSLGAEDSSEFEAFVATHPEFEEQIRNKETEIELLRSMLPEISASSESLESLENEMRASIFNLLREEPKNAWDQIKLKFEEWVNR